MFTDARSRKVVLVSHCILNQNSISDGTADFPAGLKGIVTLLIDNEIGIIQMPCPELHCLGLDRGDVHGAERPVVVENSRIRKALMKPSPLRTMKALVRHIIRQIEEYRSNGFSVVGIVGINRSPSCGVATTSRNNKEVRGQGIFIASLRKELKKREIHIPMLGIKTSEMKQSEEALKAFIRILRG